MDHGTATTEASGRQMGVPPLVNTMWEAGMEEVDPYILRRQNKATQYIVTQPILKLYEEEVQRSVLRV